MKPKVLSDWDAIKGSVPMFPFGQEERVPPGYEVTDVLGKKKKTTLSNLPHLKPKVVDQAVIRVRVIALYRIGATLSISGRCT